MLWLMLVVGLALGLVINLERSMRYQREAERLGYRHQQLHDLIISKGYDVVYSGPGHDTITLKRMVQPPNSK